MTTIGGLQILLVLGLVAITAMPLGALMARVFAGERTFLHPALGWAERGIYGAAGIDAGRGQNWLAYVFAMLAFNAGGFVLLYAIMRLQHLQIGRAHV